MKCLENGCHEDALEGNYCAIHQPKNRPLKDDGERLILVWPTKADDEGGNGEGIA
jgi:hypothetical protein